MHMDIWHCPVEVCYTFFTLHLWYGCAPDGSQKAYIDILFYSAVACRCRKGFQGALLYAMAIATSLRLKQWKTGRCFITHGELSKWGFVVSCFSRIELAPRCYGTLCARNYVTASVMLFCVFFNWGGVVMWANNRVHYEQMVGFVCLRITIPHHHHYADLSNF